MIGLRKALAAFGLKKYQALRLREWIHIRMGLVFDSYGGQGSGVFLELRDGHVALLTARHVVAECVASGELTLLSCAAPRTRSFPPGAIVVDPDADAALLYVPSNLRVPHVVRFTDWGLRDPQIMVGMPILVSGGPGHRNWKASPNLFLRSIGMIKILHYFTTAVRLRVEEDLLVCDVDEGDATLPSTFQGMSGGPAFTFDRELIGINVTEHRRTSAAEGSIDVLIRKAFASLFSDEGVFPGPLSDYRQTRRKFIFVAREASRLAKPPPRTLNCHVEYEHCESVGNPDGREGRVGILRKLTFDVEGHEQPLTVNTLARVPLVTDVPRDWIDSLALRALHAVGLEAWDIEWNATARRSIEPQSEEPVDRRATK